VLDALGFGFVPTIEQYASALWGWRFVWWACGCNGLGAKTLEPADAVH